MKRVVFKIQGMDCAEEVAGLRRAVGPVIGGADHLSCDILNGTMTVFLAVAGVATLWRAIAADMGASFLVIFNGLRLMKQ